MDEANLIWNGCLNWSYTNLYVWYDYMESETIIQYVRVDSAIRMKYCN